MGILRGTENHTVVLCSASQISWQFPNGACQLFYIPNKEKPQVFLRLFLLMPARRKENRAFFGKFLMSALTGRQRSADIGRRCSVVRHPARCRHRPAGHLLCRGWSSCHKFESIANGFSRKSPFGPKEHVCSLTLRCKATKIKFNRKYYY